MVQTKIFSDKLRESFDTTPLILAKMAESNTIYPYI